MASDFAIVLGLTGLTISDRALIVFTIGAQPLACAQ
jgi:hypothetical protein